MATQRGYAQGQAFDVTFLPSDYKVAQKRKQKLVRELIESGEQITKQALDNIDVIVGLKK